MAEPALQPQRFGRYELLQKIAVGGMAEVFLARLVTAEGAEKPLVIKRVLPNLARNREFIERFIDEARIALPLTHDAITAVFDFGRVDDDYFIAMDYVEGPDLGTLLARLRGRGEPLAVPIALHIAAQIASGLNYAHRATSPDGGPAGIVHRDVSPQNILLAFTGAVKLTDFGIARARSRLEITSPLVRGKPCYLSPEQARGEAVDGRSDLFSLGLVLHEMLTGERIFEDKSALATLQRIESAPITPPSAKRAGIDPEIDQIVLRALARPPAERYQDGQKLQGDLTRALHRIAPGFTADQVAELLAKVFPERASTAGASGGSGTVPLRDRLVSRLAGAEVGVNPEKMTTTELLRLNTVAVPVLGPAPKEAPRRAPGTTVPPPPPRKETPVETAGSRRRAPLLAVVGSVGGVVLVIAFVVWLAGGLFGDESLFPRDGPAPSILTADPATVAVGDGDAHGDDTAAPTAAPHTGSAPGTAEPGGSDTAHSGDVAVRPVTGGPRISPGLAVVNFSCLPWATVYVDGRPLGGHTPLRDVKLRPGPHKIRWYNPSSGLEFFQTIVLAPGSYQNVSIDLEAVGVPAPDH
jgi:serine/threonine-protein kinase